MRTIPLSGERNGLHTEEGDEDCFMLVESEFPNNRVTIHYTEVEDVRYLLKRTKKEWYR